MCHFCHKKGHLSRVCLSKIRQARGSVGKAKSPPQQAHAVTVAERESSPEEVQLFHIGHKQSKTKPLLCTLTIEGKPVEMEIDTGAAVSIMAERTYQQLFSHKPLQPSTVRLTTCTQSPIHVKGQLLVQVYYGQQTFDLTLVVVAGSGPSLLGRNWLQSIRLDWRAIHKASSALLTPLPSLLDEDQALFQDELGTIEKKKTTRLVRPDCTPRFFKPRPAPYAICDAVGSQLDKEGVLEKVSHSDWAAPIVVVPKQDGSYRLCGDYKVTVNQALDVDQYPLPKPEDLLATLAGGQNFTKLDLRQAY